MIHPKIKGGSFIISARSACLIVLVLLIFLLAFLLVFTLTKVRKNGNEPSRPGPREAAADYTSGSNRIEVTLFFPDRKGDKLHPEKREIFDTLTDTSKAKQVISELIAGPKGRGLLPILSGDTRIGNLYLSSDGTAYVDFSKELVMGCPSGTNAEIQTVYAIVNALTYNFTAISRVKILVGGQELLSLKGHLDLRTAYKENMDLVDWAEEEGAED